MFLLVWFLCAAVIVHRISSSTGESDRSTENVSQSHHMTASTATRIFFVFYDNIFHDRNPYKMDCQKKKLIPEFQKCL